MYSTTIGHPGPALIASTTLSTPKNPHELAEIRALLAKLEARRRQYCTKIRSRIELNKEVYRDLAYSRRKNIHVMEIVASWVELLNDISVEF
ncbi:hypothetical protein N7520_007801 [Penicillium odoratum]|uniref:uncharacterized protein n=1 Tax=Penicillium odoratum TaxID=1167516 RepID=UPI0025495D6E|nr:uncharacterized protein N7520_007801 [Penicillium odoratum]KAJ5760645.1 hypothetical protein N7520_007801 [Penicillium odoratum]